MYEDKYIENKYSENNDVYISTRMSPTHKVIIYISAFVLLTAGYTFASNKEAEYRRKAGKAISTPAPENPDYNADYVIVGDKMYVKKAGYENYHINGTVAEGYKYDENGDVISDSVSLVEVVPLTQEDNLYSGYTYNATTGEYQKTSMGPDGIPVTDCKSPEEAPKIRKK